MSFPVVPNPQGICSLLGKGKKKQMNMNVSELQKSFHLKWFLNIWKDSILILFPANYKINDEDFRWQISRGEWTDSSGATALLCSGAFAFSFFPV